MDNIDAEGVLNGILKEDAEKKAAAENMEHHIVNLYREVKASGGVFMAAGSYKREDGKRVTVYASTFSETERGFRKAVSFLKHIMDRVMNEGHDKYCPDCSHPENRV